MPTVSTQKCDSVRYWLSKLGLSLEVMSKAVSMLDFSKRWRVINVNLDYITLQCCCGKPDRDGFECHRSDLLSDEF